MPFIGNYYNADELNELLNCVKGNPIRLVIMLAAYYGLCRSEVLGLKWDAISFQNKTISIKHKVIEDEVDGMYDRHDEAVTDAKSDKKEKGLQHS